MTAFTIEETAWVRDAARLGAIRRAVFIDEQGVPEALEWDGYDAVSTHWLALAEDGSPIGCARLLPDGHLGRMAVLPAWRGRGVGRALLDRILRAAQARQTHAAGFYARAGFVADGAEYEEAGIPHVAMQRVLA
ncbi:MAG: GNAT family N-acetyltransferase [Thiobacillus sp. SCN 62-729]|nr:MAG: GNAT family N-acetyltransferase [Thiobacillus sp. SCN 62-729]